MLLVWVASMIFACVELNTSDTIQPAQGHTRKNTLQEVTNITNEVSYADQDSVRIHKI